MFKALLASTSIAALATPLAAQTVIDDERTTPITTGSLNSGAGDDLVIDTDGSVQVNTRNVVTIDSDNSVENRGTIKSTNVDGANGIRVDGRRTTNIVNSGSIILDETFQPQDADNDGDLDGPFAQGSNRRAIRATDGLVGNIQQSGEISIEGNGSYGIFVGDQLDGELIHDGETTVLGNESFGVSLQGVSGDVRLAGQVAVRGRDSVAAQFEGDIDGALIVQGEVTATGYRATERPTDTSKLDADDLLQGGPAILIEGDVREGVLFAVAPADSDPSDADEDDDGIPDADEGNATVTSFGSAPAVVIGSSTRSTEISAGDATGNGFAVVVDGEISGQGVYDGVDATGMQIGVKGGSVTIEGGLLINGKVEALSENASATALRFGDASSASTPNQVSTPGLRNAGIIEAKANGDKAETAIAVLIEAPSEVPILRNSGTINAVTEAEDGSAIAIRDRSGGLDLIENTGTISASGAEQGSARNVAIDLSADGDGATIRQLAVGANVDAPVISGDILFGTGDDALEIADGTVTGDIAFASGADRMVITGDAVYSGTVAFGGQADVLALSDTARFSGLASFANGAGELTIADQAVFSGRLSGAHNVDVAVESGTLDATGAGSVGTLVLGEDAILVATLAGDTAETTAFTVAGEAAIEEGAKLRVRVNDLETAVGTYTVIAADSVTGGSALSAEDVLLPFIFESELTATNTQVRVSVDRKDASDLGLNRSGTAAFDALYEALSEDENIANVFIQADDAESLGGLVAQTLPDHAGGTFEGINRGIRNLNRGLIDPMPPVQSVGGMRLITDVVYYDTSKEVDDTADYELNGYAARGGLEFLTGLGAFGLTTSYISSEHDTGLSNEISSESFELGAHWRHTHGPISAFAKFGYGWSDFEGNRSFVTGTGESQISDEYGRDWSGEYLSLVGGAAFQIGGPSLFVRPSVVFDYLDLTEDAFEETGGRSAFRLDVEERSSDQLGMDLATAFGGDLIGQERRDDFWLRVEAEGGWREIIAGNLGETTARFGDSDESFTLRPEDNDGGWFARLRAFAGDGGYMFGGEVGAEEQYGEVGINVRATLRFNW